MNKEIGGYLELGGLINKPYHSNCLSFNCFRSALIYYVRRKKIKKIYLPIYLCDVVYNALKKEECKIELYHIDNNFLPMLEKIELDAYIYIVNYYGLISNDCISDLKSKYNNLIIDNTHSFYRKPLENICTIYGCRKYFGVPDGAYMYSNITDNCELNSYLVGDKMSHIIGRLEVDASMYYNEFSKNDEKFSKLDICKMSDISRILMGAIDYQESLKKRIDNYNYLYKKLSKYQMLKLPLNLDFMYPLYIKNGEEVRNYLISKKIYIPKLWPNIINKNLLNEFELDYINNILPLPIDQRYDREDMDEIIKYINEKLELEKE